MYKVDCICGEPITTPAKTGRCPACRRLFDIRWPCDAQAAVDAAAPADAEIAKAAQAAAA